MASVLHLTSSSPAQAVSAATSGSGEPPASVICALPPFPPLALRAMELLSGGDFDFDDVVELTNSDPSFGAAVVHLANSPLFAARATIASTRHAVAMLGLERAGSAVMTVAMQCYARGTSPSPTMSQTWRHSVASAVIARELAAAASIEPHRAYTIGLLHDVGRIAMLSAWADEYRPLLASEYETALDVLESEHKTLRIDHCNAGSALMKTYGFPPEFTDAAGAHHHPGESAPNATRLTWLACATADALGFGGARIKLTQEAEEIAADVLADIERRRDLGSGDGRVWMQQQIDSAAAL